MPRTCASTWSPTSGTCCWPNCQPRTCSRCSPRSPASTRQPGSPVTAATLHRIRATLRAALNTAIRRGLIADNPASRAELPRARRPRAVVWTPERVEHWQRTGEHPAGRGVDPTRRPRSSSTPSEATGCMPAYHLIALRGLRRGGDRGAALARRRPGRPGRVHLPAAAAIRRAPGGVPAQDGAQRPRVIALDRTTVAALRSAP